MAIWFSKQQKDYDWGRDVGLMWVLEGQGIQYLSLQIGCHLPIEANFDKIIGGIRRFL